MPMQRAGSLFSSSSTRAITSTFPCNEIRAMSTETYSSTMTDFKDELGWDIKSLSLASSRTVSIHGSTLGYKSSPKRASTASFETTKSTSSTSTVRQRSVARRRTSVREVLVKSFTFITMFPRISYARSEAAVVRQSSVPAPLYRQTRILDDLLDLTRDELPYQMRKSALRLIQFSFTRLVEDIFTAATRQQFLKALKELCSEELFYSVRMVGLTHFNYLVGAGASLNTKSFALEYEDCRAILRKLRTITQVSLRLAAYAYLWLSFKTFRNAIYTPVSEMELRDISIVLIDLSQHPLPIETRRDALDWLWRFENLRSSDLSDDDKRIIGASILEISGYTELNGLLYYQHADAEVDYISGLRRLWWFITLRSWSSNIRYNKTKLKKVGADLLSITESSRSREIRGQGFELIALFSNLSDWRDMYDDTTWRMISDEFADFCLRDTERVKKEEIMRRVEVLLVKSASTDSETGSGVLVIRKDLHVARRMSGVVVTRYSQMTAANKAVRQYCSPASGSSVEAILENLYVFTLPGESFLIQKDQQAILYERICDYSRFNQTRLIAIQAMYALLTIQEWLSGIAFAKGPPDDCN